MFQKIGMSVMFPALSLGIAFWWENIDAQNKTKQNKLDKSVPLIVALSHYVWIQVVVESNIFFDEADCYHGAANWLL